MSNQPESWEPPTTDNPACARERCGHLKSDHDEDGCNGPLGGPQSVKMAKCGCTEFAPGPYTAETPDTPDPPVETPAQAAQMALMVDLVEACYYQAVTLAKVARMPPQYIPRTLICAAVHGIEQSIALYRRRDDLDVRGAAPFQPEQRAALHARIAEDMTELADALVEAGDSLDTVRESFAVPASTLIS